MKKVMFSVPEMTCEHCKEAISIAAIELQGVKEVLVDLEEKVVNVAYDENMLTDHDIIDAIENMGYDVMK